MDGPSPAPGTSEASSARELLWLACRAKTCCHDASVVIGGRDLWRIATTLEVAPWDFTQPELAEPGAAGAFRLEPGGAAHQIVLAKRGRTKSRGAPCVFLWRLGDGHAQCGLGSLRPLACQARPAAPGDGPLRGGGQGCTCQPRSVLDPDPELLGCARREAAEHREVVAAWHRGLAPGALHTYRDFCAHVMAAYGAMP